MKFLRKFDPKLVNVFKAFGLVILGIIVIAFAIRLIPISSNYKTYSGNSISPSMPLYDVEDEDYGESLGLSIRNIDSQSYYSVPGDDAEDFEVTEYNANFETRRLESVCEPILELKSRDDIIFENVSQSEKYCSYTFKVLHVNVDEVLDIIKGFNPKELNENTYTIKKLIDDYTSELEILNNKLLSIEETLESAIDAYDEITKLATQTKDVESLANIINSKISIIERLTQERININAQIERLERSKVDQLDRLDYTYFNIYIWENKFIDAEDIKDSWKRAVQYFVEDINSVVQGITINLLALIFLLLQYAIYLAIILVIAKYGWRVIKKFWKS